MIVLNTVASDPKMKARSKDPVSVMTLRRFESYSRRGIASGIRIRFVKSSVMIMNIDIHI